MPLRWDRTGRSQNSCRPIETRSDAGDQFEKQTFVWGIAMRHYQTRRGEIRRYVWSMSHGSSRQAVHGVDPGDL